jgi:ParB family chromosome partitioning protein
MVARIKLIDMTPAVAAGTVSTMPISRIRIGNRHRHSMGDIAGLAASISDIGLLNPISIAPDGILLAGERRLAACKKLGWNEVPVRVIVEGK